MNSVYAIYLVFEIGDKYHFDVRKVVFDIAQERERDGEGKRGGREREREGVKRRGREGAGRKK